MNILCQISTFHCRFYVKSVVKYLTMLHISFMNFLLQADRKSLRCAPPRSIKVYNKTCPHEENLRNTGKDRKSTRVWTLHSTSTNINDSYVLLYWGILTIKYMYITTVYVVPQCLSPRPNWDTPTPGIKGGGGHTRLLVRGWGIPIRTTV